MKPIVIPTPLTVIKVTRNGEQITMQRCPDCWTYRDSYPHLDNGYMPTDRPYVHGVSCPNRGVV